MRGISAILSTGGILNKSIPIGADIALVRLMTRIFIINTIAARGKAGSKDSMAFGLLEPLVLGFVVLELLFLAFVLKEPLVLVFVALEPQVLAVLTLGQLLPAFAAL